MQQQSDSESEEEYFTRETGQLVSWHSGRRKQQVTLHQPWQYRRPPRGALHYPNSCRFLSPAIVSVACANTNFEIRESQFGLIGDRDGRPKGVQQQLPVGFRVRVSLLAPGLPVRRRRHGLHQGVLQEVLAGEHHSSRS